MAIGFVMQVKSYDLELDVNFENDTYAGKEKIKLVNDGNPIILNSSGIQIDELRVNGEKAEFGRGNADDEVAISGDYNGDVELDVDFRSNVSETLMGFYIAKTPEGDKMHTTQFESSGARMAFPCFDDPSKKAEFSLTITVDDGLDCISNMPAESISAANGRKTFKFQKTPRMSTYLLYFGIGKFDEMTEKHHGVDITLTALKGHLDSTRYPIEVAAKCLEYYNNYFDIQYVLPKMHLIAVPQFGAGAMENWGAITFREIRILVNENTSESVRRDIAEVIAHEITHQWFGNLVTMEWWNDLWLNESFATFMSIKAVDKFYPEWDHFGDLLMVRTKGALLGDSLKSSHPIDADVKDPESVAQIFDEISYGKGGSILRMIEAYVGAENFRNGISGHLKNHSYGNATGQDLWQSLEDVSSMPVSSIMSVWIKKKGYPMVHVSRDGSDILLKQEQFLLSGDRTDEIWPIPLTVVRKDKVESVTMDRKEMRISGENFLKLNHKETGFYRVKYDEETLKNIMSEIDSIHQYELFGLVEDMKAFLLSGYINLDTFLSQMRGMHSRRDRVAAEAIIGAYAELMSLMPDREFIREQALEYLHALKDHLGDKADGEDENITILRGEVYSLLAATDDAFAQQISAKFANISGEDPNIRQSIATGYARTHNDLDSLLTAMKNAKSDEDRLIFVRAMGRLTGEENPKRVFALIDEGGIKKQDFMYYYISLVANPKTRAMAVGYLADVIDRLNKIFKKSGTTSTIIYRTAPVLALTNESKVREVLDSRKESSTEAGIRKALELFEIYKKMVSAN